MTRIKKLKVNNFQYYHDDGFFLYDIDKYKLIEKGILVIDRCLTKEQFQGAINWVNNLNNFGYDHLFIESGDFVDTNVIDVLTIKLAAKSKYFEHK